MISIVPFLSAALALIASKPCATAAEQPFDGYVIFLAHRGGRTDNINELYLVRSVDFRRVENRRFAKQDYYQDTYYDSLRIPNSDDNRRRNILINGGMPIDGSDLDGLHCCLYSRTYGIKGQQDTAASRQMGVPSIVPALAVMKDPAKYYVSEREEGCCGMRVITYLLKIKASYCYCHGGNDQWRQHLKRAYLYQVEGISPPSKEEKQLLVATLKKIKP
jgi:hypothetical protein